ncbi:FAD assembly factor SdhE [Sphingomonas abietis]|uniref:FAD assembly factor SdhE n=1 Tax=Sphingomonas abietis TaxID=3012344 RepID=A0ABY7NK13_9SPHN|nr:succinate dehydrogenase assembly factor 2 [Sphingomonas abietis]WBO21150.1 succinate dehydrogenase assembly factor 2 [Sphingomonas abietis]
MDRDHILKRLSFRAWHRGTREADYLIGGFFDARSAGWSDDEIVWFERLLDEDDVDVMAWAIGTQPVPEAFAGPMMQAMQGLDYIPNPGTDNFRSH